MNRTRVERLITKGGDRVVPVLGPYSMRCCAEGDWFVYLNGEMIFETMIHGFESFDAAFEALSERIGMTGGGRTS